ncbi:MAG: tripartite tricarboxylate transporter TctB family protein [Desulfobacterales bacterium]|nr:tripartite tricarboxylate transporter TctB family protein [Desulfobacterales bacterium]
MNIRIGKAEFSKHEFGLLLFCLGFFALIFFGSFKFQFIGKIFPLVIAGPGLVMVALYLISGFLPPALHQAMKKDTEFRLFGLIPEKNEDMPVEKTAISKKGRFSPQHSYTVLGLTMGYFLFSYLFGFYISTFLFTVSYLFIFRKDRKNLTSMISNLFLLAILMAMVYIFDYSFGYDFGKAAISKFL